MGLVWAELEVALRNRTPSRLPDAGLKRAAVAVVLKESSRGPEMLFIRRAEHPQDPWSGQIAFPGGRVEPGDPDLRTTAVRETAEELGLDLAHGAAYLGALDELQAMARMRPMNLAITPFVFRLLADAPLRLSEEVTSAHWLPVEELMSEEHRGSLDYEYQGRLLRFPCLRYEGVVIWGLTYRMFASLQDALAAEGTRGNPALT